LDAGRFLARFFDDFLAFVHAAQEQPNDNQHNGHFDQGKTLRTGPMFDVCHNRLLCKIEIEHHWGQAGAALRTTPEPMVAVAGGRCVV
jgi:hypothetical protein